MLRLVLLAMTISTEAFMISPMKPTTKPTANTKPIVHCARHIAMKAPAPKTIIRQAAGIAVCLAVALGTPSAALAKGGGHSSAHSSSSHSSSSHSSSSHSSSSSRSSSYRSSPGTYRSSTPRSYKSSSGSSSVSRPSSTSSSSSRSSSRKSGRTSSRKSGGRKSGRSSSRSSSYTSPPPPSRSSTVYDDTPTTVYRSSPSRTYVYSEPSERVIITSPADTAFHNGLWLGRLESATLLGGAYYLYNSWKGEDEWDEVDDDVIWYAAEEAETRGLMKELVAEFDQIDPLVAAIRTPTSTRYVGRSAEDDDGDQDIVTELTFNKDGRWSSTGDELGGARVAWIEEYAEGFEVALRGQIRADGTIMGMWASDRGVSGSVELVRDQ